MRDRATRRIGTLATAILLLSLNSCGVQPIIRASAVQEGIASYYSNDFQGRKTSDGEIFDNSKLTAAHRTYPFGTIVDVGDLDNGRHVQVRINDRGPVKPERIIDLSFAAARIIGIDRSGLGRVRISVIEWGKSMAKRTASNLQSGVGGSTGTE